jgi:hypothetical protein
MVNPRAWNPAAADGLQVACLFPAMHLYSIQDDCVRPIFEWAEQNNRAVFVTLRRAERGASRAKLGLESRFDLRFSNPADLHAVALRHPRVPIIVPHFGAGYFREALMLADLCPNVYLDYVQLESLDAVSGIASGSAPGVPPHARRGGDPAVSSSEPIRRSFRAAGSTRIFEDQARALY